MTFAASQRRHVDCAPQQAGDKVLASTTGNMWLSHDAGRTGKRYRRICRRWLWCGLWVKLCGLNQPLCYLIQTTT